MRTEDAAESACRVQATGMEYVTGTVKFANRTAGPRAPTYHPALLGRLFCSFGKAPNRMINRNLLIYWKKVFIKLPFI
jgi:hypothetical protein